MSERDNASIHVQVGKKLKKELLEETDELSKRIGVKICFSDFIRSILERRHEKSVLPGENRPKKTDDNSKLS